MDTYNVGDEVAIVDRYNTCIGTVVRVTRTGRVVAKCGALEWTFDKHGFELGRSGSFDITRVVPVTQSHRDIVERTRLIAKIARVQWHSLNLDVLRNIVNALDAGKGK